MAKTNNSDLLDLESTPKAPAKAKTEKVKILGLVRADFGAYDEGDVVELPAEVVKELKAEGLAEAFKGESKPEKTEEEEF